MKKRGRRREPSRLHWLDVLRPLPHVPPQPRARVRALRVALGHPAHMSRAWWAALPPPRVLYTDPSGGQIEGYSADDVRAIVERALRDAIVAPEQRMRLHRRQARVLALLIERGSPSAAAATVGVSTQALHATLQRLRERHKCKTNLQLCVEFARRGWEPM